MANSTSEHRGQARAIRFPFPCGCMDAHEGGGMAVEEYTCAAHRAIAEALSARDVESYRNGILDAAKTVCDCCANEARYGPALPSEGSTRLWHGDYPCNATYARALLSGAQQTSSASSRDAEVREVLEGLATYRNPQCWCPPDSETEPHSEACRATTALYTKLQPKQ